MERLGFENLKKISGRIIFDCIRNKQCGPSIGIFTVG